MHRGMRAAGLGVALVAMVCLLSARPAAHEIPTDVRIQAFFKPEGQRLRLPLRVPLSAMQDIDYPRLAPEGYLDISRADAALGNAANLWIANQLEVYEGDTRLPHPSIAAARVSLPADRSFRSYDTALAHFGDPPLPNDTDLFWNQGMLDVLFEYPIQSDRSRFSIHVGLSRLGLQTTTVLRFLPPGGAERAFEFHGDPGLVRLDPRWHQAALRFVELGFFHILDGIDHLLFLFCLVIPFRRFRALVLIVTSFTVAHSITLIASAYDFAPDALWFPALVETLIAMSIVYMALENIVAANLPRRWLITFAFGLVHGFGFSFALRETLQFAGSHLLTSLLSFNLGVEIGQLLVLVVVIPMLGVVFRHVVAERMGTIILSAIVAHTGWHWMIDRGGQLLQYDFQWPALDAAFLASVLRWLMLAVLTAGIFWLVSGLLKQRRASSADVSEARGADLSETRGADL